MRGPVTAWRRLTAPRGRASSLPVVALVAGSLPGVVAAALPLLGAMAARRTAWAWVAVAMLRCPAAAEMRRRLCHAGGTDQLNCATCMSYCGVCDPSCSTPRPTPRPTPSPTPHPTREPTSYPTQFKFQSGWCSSTLDEYAGDASNVQECWEKCESAHGSSLVAVDLDLDNECYCQDDCQCLDLGHGMGYYVATRENFIAELPGMCGGCSDVCTEGLYKGSCTGFKREAKGKWGDWTLPGYEGIACSKDQCCASNKGECCELNVGMIAGVAVAIFVVVAGCIGVCCFLGCKKRKQESGKPPSLPLVGDAREPPPPALVAMPPPTPPPALVPIPEHKKQRRFPEPTAPLPPTLAPIKAQAAGMLTEETPPQPSVPVAEPVQSTSSVGWGARSLQRLASWRAPAPETSEMEPEPEVPAAAPPPITLGGKKVDVA